MTTNEKRNENIEKKYIRKQIKRLEKLARQSYIKKELVRIDYHKNYYNMLDNVGNSIHRSYIDDEVIRQIKENDGEMSIDVEINLETKRNSPIIDTDGDGIPDEIEDLNNLDKFNPVDSKFIDPSTGELNIEKYIKNIYKGVQIEFFNPYL